MGNSRLSDGTLLQGGKYRIVRFLGAGGFGCTYEAHFGLLDARVAIKEFFPETMCNRDAAGCISVPTDGNREFVGKMRRKFVEEARTLYKYKDIDGIVKVADIFEENGTAYFVMDFIDGKSVQNLIDSRGRLSEAEVLRIIDSVGRALQAVHELGSLHLDIKPDNIMIGADGRPILIDFGVSKQFDEDGGCNTSTLMGYTPGYAPLEQMNSNVQSFSAATDVYALAATLYAMLTGKRPPKATDLLNDVETLRFPDDISPATRSAIEAAMEPKVKRRPQTVAAFLALLPTTASKPAPKPTPKPVPKPRPASSTPDTKPIAKPNPHSHTQYIGPKPNKNKKYLLIAIAAAVVAIIGVIAWQWPTTNDAPLTVSVETITVNGVPFDMVRVDGGSFMMGSDEWDWAKPVHSESVGTFSIGKTEVTQALWKAVMGSNPSNWQGDDLPVEKVSWDDCQEFIQKLNGMTGKNFRLPTEAEWEYAARGGQRSRGYKYSGSDNIGDVAWYDGNSGSKTHPVAQKSSNELGLYDMSGNVWEWTADDWRSDYSSNPTNSGRGFRGGGWDIKASYCSSANRNGANQGFRPDNLGLRLAL